MPTLFIKRGDTVFEVKDLTLEELKELTGLNGHRGVKPGTIAPARFPRPDPNEVAEIAPSSGPDYHGFRNSLSAKGRKFFEVLAQRPDGVDASTLAKELGFASANGIGGLAGGGLAKIAKKFSVRLPRLYSSQIIFTNGVRERIFKPGKDFRELQ